MEIDLSQYEESIQKAYKQLGYKLDKNEKVTVECLIDIIDELVEVNNHVLSEIRHLENDLQDNYKPIPREEQYE